MNLRRSGVPDELPIRVINPYNVSGNGQITLSRDDSSGLTGYAVPIAAARSSTTIQKENIMTPSATQQGSEQATDKTAIRPFHVNDVPEAELTELRRRINATRWPERETVTDAVAGRAARDDSGARPLLGDGIRLAQGRGETERPSRSSSPRSMGWTFISFTCVRSTTTRCRSSSRTDGPARSSSR